MKPITFFLLAAVLAGVLAFGLYRLVYRGLTLAPLKRRRLWSAVGAATLLALAITLDGVFSVSMLALAHLLLFDLLAALWRWLLRPFVPQKLRRLAGWIYRLSLVPILCTALFLTAGYRNMTHPVSTRYTVTTEKSISGGHCRVAVLSDLHYGSVLTKETLETVCRDISRENADVVILCGDVVDESTTYAQLQEVFSYLGDIECTYGVYYVYGNHDRALYSRNPGFTGGDLTAALLDNSITVLRDQTVALENGLTLVGREDRSQAPLSVASLLSGVDRSRYLLVADHQPWELAEKAAAGVDLQISGHTHGGQIFPIGYLTVPLGHNEMNYGMKAFGSMTAIVTSGLSGWGVPIRTQGVSEYLLIDILTK